MALYVDRDDGTYITWHIGQSPEFQIWNGIRTVQADGDELEHIQNNFTSIPMRTGKRVVIWHGEMAQFIVDNL